MLWTLDFDDYTGQFCNEGTFPIANAIKSVFDEFSVVATTAVVASSSSESSSGEDNNNKIVSNNNNEILLTTTQEDEDTTTTSTSKLDVFIGSGDIVFSGSINGISIGYDPSLGVPPASNQLFNNNINSSQPNLTATPHVVIESGRKNSATNINKILSSSSSIWEYLSSILFVFFPTTLFVFIT